MPHILHLVYTTARKSTLFPQQRTGTLNSRENSQPAARRMQSKPLGVQAHLTSALQEERGDFMARVQDLLTRGCRLLPPPLALHLPPQPISPLILRLGSSCFLPQVGAGGGRDVQRGGGGGEGERGALEGRCKGGWGRQQEAGKPPRTRCPAQHLLDCCVCPPVLYFCIAVLLIQASSPLIFAVLPCGTCCCGSLCTGLLLLQRECPVHQVLYALPPLVAELHIRREGRLRCECKLFVHVGGRSPAPSSPAVLPAAHTAVPQGGPSPRLREQACCHQSPREA